MSEQRCMHCNHVIRLINYAMGPEWMHVDPNASFPTTGKGTAWRVCRSDTVAEPAKSIGKQRFVKYGNAGGRR